MFVCLFVYCRDLVETGDDRQSMSFDGSVNVCYPRQERVNVSYYKYDLENE